MTTTMTLEQSQQVAYAKINNFTQFLINDFFTWNNNQWNSDAQSQSNITGVNMLALLNGGNLPPGFQWRDYYNNMNTVTGADMAAMFVAGANFVFAVYNAAWKHKANVAALTDPDAVKNYHFGSNYWPDPMVEL